MFGVFKAWNFDSLLPLSAGHGRKRSSGAAEGGQGGGNPGPARRRKTLNSVTEDTGYVYVCIAMTL